MITETEIESRGLVAFVAGLAGALGAVADHVTASGVPPQLADALDDLVKALRRTEEALCQGLKTSGKPSDPWALGLPKILTEVAATFLAFVAVLAATLLYWWTRRLDELGRRQDAEPEQSVENGVGR